YNQGKALYLKYCATCHGRDRNGDEPLNPSLRNLQNKLTPDAALARILQGSGRMPSFSTILKGKEDAIIAFLFETRDTRPSRAEADLFEIHNNRSSLLEEKNTKAHTPELYLNMTPFSHWHDPNGKPSIKPPWGTLSAINLHTGDYEWQV